MCQIKAYAYKKHACIGKHLCVPKAPFPSFAYNHNFILTLFWLCKMWKLIIILCKTLQLRKKNIICHINIWPLLSQKCLWGTDSRHSLFSETVSWEVVTGLTVSHLLHLASVQKHDNFLSAQCMNEKKNKTTTIYFMPFSVNVKCTLIRRPDARLKLMLMLLYFVWMCKQATVLCPQRQLCNIYVIKEWFDIRGII